MNPLVTGETASPTAAPPVVNRFPCASFRVIVTVVVLVVSATKVVTALETVEVAVDGAPGVTVTSLESATTNEPELNRSL